MRPALHAEWTKMRTLASPPPLLLGAIAVTVALSAAVTSVLTCSTTGCGGEDTTRLSLTGVDLGQALVAILAAGAVSGEYSTGMIRTTLTAMPAPCHPPGRQSRHPHRRRDRDRADEPTLRAAAGSVLYLTLIALLSLGIATALRDSATSIGVVLGLLYLLPIISLATGNPHLQRLLQQTGPMNAGLAIQATTDLRSLPISPWAGLGVLAAWTAAALLTGALLLRLRDA
jgi:ABC-2 type transport system permease protein